MSTESVPDRARHVLLVRHGRTALNAEGRLRGLADPELDDIGLEEAQETAEALRGRQLSVVVSSPLQRAVRTARVIADASGVAAIADPAFNDRDYGPWTGHLKADVIREWGSVDRAPGVEPEDAVLARAWPALNALTAPPGEWVAVVTHDAVIRPILRTIDPNARAVVETASWAELRLVGDRWRIDSLDNQAPHPKGAS
jgi:broad specificity phosphatase PhoE